jgi:phage protein D
MATNELTLATLKEVAEESKSQNGFYVPDFQVRIKERKKEANLNSSDPAQQKSSSLPKDVVNDILEVTYKDSITAIDSFELTLNNALAGSSNCSTNRFKYIGSETEESAKKPLARLFEPCNKDVEIYMGYAHPLKLMMTGQIITMEPTFSSGGASTLNVRGLNLLHQLRRKQHSYAWTEKRVSEIALSIASLPDGKQGKKRIPIPVVVDEGYTKKEHPIEYISQKNQYDIDFLFMLARMHGKEVFIKPKKDKKTKKTKRELHFKSSESKLNDIAYELEWGKSLIDFKPVLTTANQIRSVTVTGWNRRRKEPISETVNLDDPKLNRNRDLHAILQRCAPREEIVVDEPVFTKAQARERAINILNDRQKEMIKASGTTIGLPDLRAGQWLVIKGLGARLSGLYFVTETTHTINDSGYTTRFQARREDNLSFNLFGILIVLPQAQ